MPRLLLCAALGALIGLVIAIAGSDWEVSEATVVGFFAAASVMTVSLHRRLDLMLLWVLFIDATVFLFQVALYGHRIDLPAEVRLAPVLVATLIFALAGRGRRADVGLTSLFWIGLSVPVLIAALLSPTMGAMRDLAQYVITILYPFAIYGAIRSMPRREAGSGSTSEIFAISIVILATVPLLLIPVELTLRQGGGFAALQFGGRAYAVIGVVFLIWPLLINSMRHWPIAAAYFGLGTVTLLIATSFSRGAMIGITLLVVATIMFGLPRERRIMVHLGIASLVVAGIAILFLGNWFDDLTWFWLLRTNLASNAHAEVSFNAADFFTAGRGEIWQFGWQLFREQPVWGHGIGSTPVLFAELTNNQFSYSGMHNMVLTVLVERGLIGVSALLFVLLRILFLILRGIRMGQLTIIHLIAYGVFLLFANSTGVELFMNSSRLINVTATVYLLGYLGWLESHAYTAHGAPIRTPTSTRFGKLRNAAAEPQRVPL